MNVVHFAQLDKDTILLCAESEYTAFHALGFEGVYALYDIFTFVFRLGSC